MRFTSLVFKTLSVIILSTCYFCDLSFAVGGRSNGAIGLSEEIEGKLLTDCSARLTSGSSLGKVSPDDRETSIVDESKKFDGIALPENQSAQISHWIEWTGRVVVKGDRTSSRTRVLIAIRSELYEILTTNPSEARLAAIEQLLNAWALFDSPVFSSEVREYYYPLFLVPDFRPFFLTLGTIESANNHYNTTLAIEQILTKLSLITRNLDGSLSNAVLTEIGSHLLNAVNSGRIDPYRVYLGVQIDWPSHLARMQSRMDEILMSDTTAQSDSRWQAIPSDLRNRVALHSAVYPNRRTEEIVRKLCQFEWFTSQPLSARMEIFYALNYAAHLAESTSFAPQRRILTNSINMILMGGHSIIAQTMESGVGGTASKVGRRMNLNLDSMDGAPLIVSERLAHGTLFVAEVLAHEAMHLMSDQGVEASVAYFEEEMRAYTVGFIARHGRNPSQRDVADIAVHLLIGAHSPDSPYQLISEAWYRNPRRFQSHLRALGFENPSELRKQADHVSRTKEAPAWDWETYHARFEELHR